MDEAELKARTKRFSLGCMRLAESLPIGRSGNTIASQLIRCGTSVGANYRAACRGRSRAEFLSKLGVVEEEADEAGFWMELVIDSGMIPAPVVRPLHSETQQLVAITVASIRTARQSKSPIRNPQSKIQNR
jgi:four helix bundle protein